MALFSKAKNPEKPAYLLEQELEQEQRIRAALEGLRKAKSTKNPFNMMLQGSKGLSASRAPANLPIGTLLSASPGSGAFGDIAAGGYNP